MAELPFLLVDTLSGEEGSQFEATNLIKIFHFYHFQVTIYSILLNKVECNIGLNMSVEYFHKLSDFSEEISFINYYISFHHKDCHDSDL